MTEADFQAALNALQSLKNGVEQLVVNQAITIAQLNEQLVEAKKPYSIASPSSPEAFSIVPPMAA